MEAVAKHDFNATADDELSFAKNAVIKVWYLFRVDSTNTVQNNCCIKTAASAFGIITNTVKRGKVV